VLRFPSEPVWLALGPHQVGLARGRRGRAKGLGAADVAARPDSMAAAILEAAAALLDKHAVSRARVHTVLSDRLVRYVLLPFSPTRLDGEEERALCLAMFAELYGPMTDWVISIDRARYGKARVACALAPELAQGLAGLLAERALKPGSIVPHFVSSWNARRGELARLDGMLAVVEPDSLVIGRFAAGGWSALRTHYAATGGGALDDLILRERLHQQCDPDTPVWVCGSVDVAASSCPALRATAARSADPGLAMALAAASA
jgi:hypothetical protein